MSEKFVVFSKTGFIEMYVEGSEHLYSDVNTMRVNEFVDYTKVFVDVDSKTLQQRPPHSITINKTHCSADGVDVVTISNAAGKIYLNGTEYPLIDSTVNLTFEESGKYIIQVKNFPIQDFEAIIHAN